jgi:hypothetical protein
VLDYYVVVVVVAVLRYIGVVVAVLVVLQCEVLVLQQMVGDRNMVLSIPNI